MIGREWVGRESGGESEREWGERVGGRVSESGEREWGGE